MILTDEDFDNDGNFKDNNIIDYNTEVEIRTTRMFLKFNTLSCRSLCVTNNCFIKANIVTIVEYIDVYHNIKCKISSRDVINIGSCKDNGKLYLKSPSSINCPILSAFFISCKYIDNNSIHCDYIKVTKHIRNIKTICNEIKTTYIETTYVSIFKKCTIHNLVCIKATLPIHTNINIEYGNCDDINAVGSTLEFVNLVCRRIKCKLLKAKHLVIKPSVINCDKVISNNIYIQPSELNTEIRTYD